MAGDAARQKNPVEEEREIVTVLLMEVLMMAMLDVEEILFAAAIIVNSLGPISMRRTTVVMWRHLLRIDPHLSLYLELL